MASSTAWPCSAPCCARARSRADRAGLVVRRRERGAARHGRDRSIRATPVIFLDTGKLFEETQDYRDELTALLGLEDVRVVRPEPAALARQDAERHALARTSPTSAATSARPRSLDRALDGFAAWITGRKRFQGGPAQRAADHRRRALERPDQAQPAGALVGRGRRALSAPAQPAGASAGRRRLRLDRLRALHPAGRTRRAAARRPLVGPGQGGMRHPPAG